MEMKGESRIEAPRERVWQALNDPEVLKASIDGCEELEKVSDTELTAKVRAKVGPVSARFGGRVTLTDLDPPNGYRIQGEGTGGAAGFAKGGAVVTLESEGSATILRYDVQATVGGKLAQIGSRLIDGVARSRADDFFARFKAHLEGPTAGEGGSSAPGNAASSSTESASGSGSEAAGGPPGSPAVPLAGGSQTAAAAPPDLPSAPELGSSVTAEPHAPPSMMRPGPEMARAATPSRTEVEPQGLDATPGVDRSVNAGAPSPSALPPEVPPDTRPMSDIQGRLSAAEQDRSGGAPGARGWLDKQTLLWVAGAAVVLVVLALVLR